ncbi:Uncharacterized protein APZ42_020384 [Daphnia magna]|uniref:Uncharacterized protein n=1 Tax=Daphnia magna TaxID=35525 RepID=A0A164XJB3_9CRUS|nr:Uncharacterized protein APZ42_020384 [Daphnia magna]
MKRQLEDCKTWFIDATFHLMEDPMKQLFFINGFIKNDKSDSKQVPLLICCMTRRRAVDYIAVFEKLKVLKITKFRFNMNYILHQNFLAIGSTRDAISIGVKLS